jgi:hypothetical protein
MRGVLVRSFFRIAPMANYAAVRIALGGSLSVDFLCHLGILVPDGLDTGMALGSDATLTRGWIGRSQSTGKRYNQHVKKYTYT